MEESQISKVFIVEGQLQQPGWQIKLFHVSLTKNGEIVGGSDEVEDCPHHPTNYPVFLSSFLKKKFDFHPQLICNNINVNVNII